MMRRRWTVQVWIPLLVLVTAAPALLRAQQSADAIEQTEYMVEMARRCEARHRYLHARG